MIRLALIIQLCLLLLACGGGKGDDLDKFMEDSAKDMHAKIEPLPEVKPYVPLQYNADGSLSDPFKPRKALATNTAAGNNTLQPDMNRPKEALEAYPLESLKYVGSIEKAKLKFALIRAPDNNIQQVKIGNYMGQNFGMVIDITDSSVMLKEIAQDELSGDWVERSASVNLQE
jgi:type IV pilus assembly protein PilP